RRPRDLEELAVPLEDVLAQRADHDLRGLHEAGARLLHRDAESRVLHAARASPMGTRIPAYTTLAAPRPNPSRHRPPDRMSSRAISSAIRTGSCHGSTITAVPRVTRLVRPAKEARNSVRGGGMA